MTPGPATPVLLINPLKSTLAHYETQLAETLRHAGCSVETAGTVSGDYVSGAAKRAWVALTTVVERIRMGRSVRGRIVIVAWPLFGYFEPLTLLSLARSNSVFIIVHDPSPLRRAYGHSRLARLLFRAAAGRQNIQILYHTAHAQRVGTRVNGVSGHVVPHPVGSAQCDDQFGQGTSTRPLVRVLGQNKQTRSMAALKLIAANAGGRLSLEIHGRAWPPIPGWELVDGFVPEHEFTALLRTSDCVVIPYDSFFQSGVAARCLESGVRVVAPEHEHIAQLYGDDWPGTVREDTDWYDGVLRALAVDTRDVHARHAEVFRNVQHAWREFFETVSPVTGGEGKQQSRGLSGSLSTRRKLLSHITFCRPLALQLGEHDDGAQ